MSGSILFLPHYTRGEEKTMAPRAVYSSSTQYLIKRACSQNEMFKNEGAKFGNPIYGYSYKSLKVDSLDIWISN